MTTEPPPVDPAAIAEMFIENLTPMFDAGTLNAEGVQYLVQSVNMLPPKERAQWLRGRRAKLQIAKHGGQVARSTAYYLTRIGAVIGVLTDAGLLDPVREFRDAETGRRVKTLIGELARLNWADDDDALIATYRDFRVMPLGEVKQIVRLVNRRAAHTPGGTGLAEP